LMDGIRNPILGMFHPFNLPNAFGSVVSVETKLLIMAVRVVVLKQGEEYWPPFARLQLLIFDIRQ